MTDTEKKRDDAAPDTAEPEETRRRYETSVETIGPCKVEVSITVPVETLKEELDERYREIIKTIAFPGFRLGHAPRRLVEKKLGDEVRGDVREHLVNESFREAMDTHDLDPITEPEIDIEEIDIESDGPITWKATVLTRPVVELPDYEKITVAAVPPVVSEADVEYAIEHIRRQHAVLEPVSDAVKQGDVVVIDYVARAGETEIHKSENVEYTHPARFAQGFPIDGLAEEILGKSAGAELTLTTNLPDAWFDADLAGAEMTVTVTLKEVKRPVLPELDDEFVKGLDYDDADELREDVRDQVRREAEHAATEQTNQAMIDAVIAAAPFDLPEDVVAEATKSHIENTKARLRMEGVGGEEFEQQVAEARAATRDKIEREFRMTFLMAAIGKAEKIFVTEREVDDRIAQIAPAYHRTPEAMHAHLEQRDQIGEIRTRMRDEKVVEFLRGKVKIEGEA